MKIDPQINRVKQTIDARNLKVPTSNKVTPSLDPEVKNDNPVTINESCATHQNIEGLELLNVLWGSKDVSHQIGILDRKTKVFKNLAVENTIDALNQIDKIDNNSEKYFACAEYSNTASRTATNVSGARAFWMDFDCGEDKDKDNKGYLTKEMATRELNSFCEKYGIPQATHIVDSGNGLHVYWGLDGSVCREKWQGSAKKLKTLTIQANLKVDGSRTADIASVLRVPGTMNNKSDTPKPVRLIEKRAELIKVELMLQSIEDAHKKLDADKPAKNKNVSTSKTVILESDRPSLIKLESALKKLDPDCDEATWKLRRIAPLANAAADFPDLSDELYIMAKKWSSGELAGTASVAWSTPGNSNGITGEEAFEIEWKRFFTSNFTGTRTNLGTIYFDAKEAGWNAPEEEFTTIDKVSDKAVSDIPKEPLQAIQKKFSLLNVGGKLYVLDNERLQTSAGQPAQKLELSNRVDATLFIERALEAQFPNIAVHKVPKEFFKSPKTTCYDGVDFHPKGVNKNYLNLWVGPHRKAKKGKWERIHSFLLNVICDGDLVSYQYLIGYMAHALKRPEEKPGVMLILLGSQGIGKGTLGRIFQKIWTSTYLQISNIDHVVGNFNAALERAFIVFMDEALFSGDRKSSDALKSLVTEPFIQINEKHQPARQTQSFHRFIAATNALHFKNTEHDDRRDFVLKVSECHKNDHDYWLELDHEMNNGGIEALLYDLEEMDLTEFNVRAKPSTAGLLEQKLMSLGSIERWWYDCLDCGQFDSASDSGLDLELMGFTDNSGWSDFISTQDAINYIWTFNAGRMFKKPSAADVIKAITTVCPSAKGVQKQENNVRRRGLSLPLLQVAREEFESYLGGSVSWSDLVV